MTEFTEEQSERYSCHILLDDAGVNGQGTPLAANLLIIGAGGLGSPVGIYLAAAGVGTIGIIDNDSVEILNLQRQTAHFTKDISLPDVDSAAAKMKAITLDIAVRIYNIFLWAENIAEIIKDYDLVIDGTDNFPSKFLVNNACIFLGIPFSHAGILRFNGQTMIILPGRPACCRCSFRKQPPPDTLPSCAQAGVLGAMAGMLGTLQAAEALKFTTETGELLTNGLLTVNAKNITFRKIRLIKYEECPVCGYHPEISEFIDAEQTACSLH